MWLFKTSDYINDVRKMKKNANGSHSNFVNEEAASIL